MSHPPETGWGGGRVAMLMGLLALASCEKTGGPSNQGTRRWPATIAECDPAGYIRCISDAAWISIPVANTGLSLTYSSSRGVDSSGRTTSTATTFGIGGWSIDAVRQYDRSRGILT